MKHIKEILDIVYEDLKNKSDANTKEQEEKK